MFQAWGNFDGNMTIQSKGHPPIACHKGCPGWATGFDAVAR